MNKRQENNDTKFKDLSLNTIERDLSRLMTLFKLRNPEGSSC